MKNIFKGIFRGIGDEKIDTKLRFLAIDTSHSFGVDWGQKFYTTRQFDTEGDAREWIRKEIPLSKQDEVYIYKLTTGVNK